MLYPNIREEEQKNKAAQDYYPLNEFLNMFTNELYGLTEEEIKIVEEK